jgi:hypothetical protein
MPEGQTVNQVYYKEILTALHERVKRKRPEMWKNSSWILHHDNAPAHNALSVTTFLAKDKILVLEHRSYSPDLARVVCFISKNQICINNNLFEFIDAMKAKAMEVMKKLSEKNLQRCSKSGKLEWSSEGDGEGTILKVITFPLCD